MTEQEKRAKVIAEIERVADEANPWKESPPLRCDISYPLLIDALDLLKAHEPLLMNFSDIQTMSKVDVYLEDRGSDLVYPLMLLGAENSNKSQTVFFHPMTVKPLGAYGKTWRCWTCRPSQKQREETPWE